MQKINRLKCSIPGFLRQKCVDTSYVWCFNDFGARFDGKKIGFGDWMEKERKLMMK